MKRTKGIRNNFTQIPKELLRNSELTPKAKGILCQLLSNKDSLKNTIKQLTKQNKTGKTSIRSGLKELERKGYLLRLEYRNSKSQIKGTFWAYTAQKWEFSGLSDKVKELNSKGFSVHIPSKINNDLENPTLENPTLENPTLEKLILENPTLKINDVD